MIANFSVTHRLHLPVVFWYSVAFFRTSHLISKFNGVFVFQGPDVLGQSRASLVLLVPKRLLVGIESLFESLCSQAGVIPLVFSSNSGGLVDDGVNLEHTVQWASVFVPAVARLFAGRVFLDSSRTPSGFSEEAEYLAKRKSTVRGKRRNRPRKITWFNPPFSQNVATNVGRKFRTLIRKHFPKSSKLYKIFNKNTLKISYSCMPNITAVIRQHNIQRRGFKFEGCANCPGKPSQRKALQLPGQRPMPTERCVPDSLHRLQGHRCCWRRPEGLHWPDCIPEKHGSVQAHLVPERQRHH